jgi:RNA polymerase sigma-70 factor (ECF subfamily)
MFQIDVVEKCKSNDRNAQLQLYRQYCDGMYAVAMRFVKNSNDAEDVLQESFVKAFQKLHQFKGEVTFGAWLKKIVVHKCIDFLKSKKQHLVSLDETYMTPVAEEDWTVEDGISLEVVKKEIEKLSEKYKYVVLMYLVEGFDHKEIAQVLDITETTCRTRLLRGKGQLKELLKTKRYGTGSREMFKKERSEQRFKLKEGHETRFLDRLDEALPKQKKFDFSLLKIAASVLLVVGLSFFGYLQFAKDGAVNNNTVTDVNANSETDTDFSFGDLSPDLKKIENYYVANINMELSKLEVSDDNKELIDSYMERLAELNAEYEALNAELNELGPNDQTISALIENLQLRLQLLQQLKKQLNQVKTSKNEQII